ncbi:hypothetical protein N7490_003336 [Penicillium lividum]|nr:hypothetical protein N7490_003336 [Penicillium lividum]
MYFPSADEMAGTFWADLHLKITAILEKKPVLKTRHGRFRKIDEVKILVPKFSDVDGNLLLDDSDIDSFLSSHYPDASSNALRGFDAFRSDSQLERDLKVGAAGELFVFELLSRLSPSLTGWGEWNWQSSIRRYVTLHPDYADMAPWYGRETADMTYDDMAGEFTALLIDREYLGAEEWADERPKYFIEVKATTGPLDQPFFMSKHQYQRMRAIHNRNDFPEVYLIFRVFDICGGNLGMKVYLDPEQLRLDEGLVFTEQSWSVVPGQ